MAGTPSDALAELREEYKEDRRESGVDVSALTVQSVTSVDAYPTWDEFEIQFKPVTNYHDTNASFGA